MSLALAGGFFTIGDMGSIPGSGRSPGKENGNPLLKSPMDKEAWQATYSSQGHKQLDMIEQLSILPLLAPGKPLFSIYEEIYIYI